MFHFAPASIAALIVLVFCFGLACVFEFANGSQDAANAVATVIHANSLKPEIIYGEVGETPLGPLVS